MARILLVEPDKVLGQTTARALVHFGHHVYWTPQAQQAIKAIDSEQPDVIILELQLPVHNGIELLYELRSYHDLQDIPVIVHSMVPPTLKAISPMLWDKVGISAYLYKPHTTLHNLNETIDNILAPVS